ncbi:Vacuolar protein sorting-associated protein 54, chloroplastic [Pseudocercospora fuligena]|uniref:Vacuolar protein sorting-associated protein 54 n=1 Tax=Pseudocercospora fuligena TaxID=685502 RepID=A0A8H6RF44_9PEZI|nr:Vacuolar protein sorting-associated protein 54, chloroplastic [Pseudocercospora fuligena]
MAFSPRFSVDSPADLTSPSSQRSAYPFPTQDGRPSSSRRMSRRGSTASQMSVGSIGGSLDIHLQTRRGSTVRETSQNAISTLLQPPIVRTGLLPHTQASAAAAGFKAPTTKDIPPVTLTNVPHVPPDNFRDYLNRIGPLFESFQRGRAESEQHAWLKKDKELEKAEALERRLSRDNSTPTTPVSPNASRHGPISPLERPSEPRRKSSAQFRRNRNEPTPLSTIPNVYFDEDFHLENPRTFDVVSERSEIVRPPPGSQQAEQKSSNGAPQPPRKALATNAILQEKLSWYMDTVEVHLINSISTASSGFFAALGSLKELQTEAEQSVAKIQSLRDDLRRLDKEVAVSGLEVAAKRRRRENVRKLRSATAQVQSVVENISKADELVDAGAYSEAADQMDRVGRLVCGHNEPGQDNTELIDLRPLRALQGLDSGLQELQLRIGTGYAQSFESVLMKDLREHVGRVPSEQTLKRWSRQRGIPPTYMETDDSFRKDLLSALNGLARAGHTAPAAAAYREAVNKEVKSIIRRSLPSSSDDDADSMVSTSTRGGSRPSQQEKSMILSRNLRALDAEDAEKLLISVYTSISEALRRVSTQTKIILDVTSQMQAPESKVPARSPGEQGPNDQFAAGMKADSMSAVREEITQALDMSSLLGQAVDTAQTQIGRVLKVRNEQAIRLPLSLFLRYFTLNRLFADECEAVSGRGGNVLKGIINAQLSGFVQVLGTAEAERTASLLENDSWNAEDFSDKDNTVLQRILASMSSDPPEWTKITTQIWEEPGPPPIANGVTVPDQSNGTNDKPTANGTTPAAGGKAPVKPAYIDESRYVLVSSAASLLSIIDTFLSLTSWLPSMTSQISTSLLEVLRAFNSRTNQMILGAGATRVGGLKNITTKHLALASQALSFVIALIPYMRECVRRHIPAGQGGILAEFDKTKRLYQDHQSGVHDKLVDIMTSRSAFHIKAMHNVDFDKSSADDKPNAYMEQFTKELLVLYRTLSRHLSEVDVGMIMRQIFATVREQWTQAYGDLDVNTRAGEKRLLRDVELLEAKLGKLEGFEPVGREIAGVVKAKISLDDEPPKKVEEEKKKPALAAPASEAFFDQDEEKANGAQDEGESKTEEAKEEGKAKE